jgi:predicted ATP-grasp superfamily ATP-dependent carboligase
MTARDQLQEFWNEVDWIACIGSSLDQNREEQPEPYQVDKEDLKNHINAYVEEEVEKAFVAGMGYYDMDRIIEIEEYLESIKPLQ